MTTRLMWIKRRLLSLVTLFLAAGCNLLVGSPPEFVDVFVSGTDGYHTYRIPAIVVSKQHTLLAFCEGRKSSRSDTGRIDLLLKRSTDAGRTWHPQQVIRADDGNVCGNPAPVVDQTTGEIWLLMTWNRGDDEEREILEGKSVDTRRVFVTSSRDDGLTWSKPREITQDVKKPHWRWYATGPVNGIQLMRGPHKGRLVVPANHSDHADPAKHPFRAHVIYSDDHGKTWQLGGVEDEKTNESTVAERSDGSLLHNMRSYHGKNRRAVATSADGGLNWSALALDEALVEPVCQASLLRYSWPDGGKPGIVLFSNPASTKRENLTVRLSYDDASTWPVARTLYGGPAAYSCLVVLPDQRTGCFFECGAESPYEKLVLGTFPISWLKEGRPTEPEKTTESVGSSPARDFAEYKIYDSAGRPFRFPVEDWAGAQRRVREELEWQQFVRRRRAELDEWIAKRQDRVEWAAFTWNALAPTLCSPPSINWSGNRAPVITSVMPRILIADDQADVLEALRLLLKGEGYATELVTSPAAVLSALARQDFDLVLMDLNYTRDTTSGTEGLDLLARIQALDSTLPIVVMTAWGSVELVVEAMRRGAKDFCQKPWDNNRLLTTIRTQLELRDAVGRGRKLEAENQLLRQTKDHALIAQSPAMQPVLHVIERVGPSDANVLITGENGTGKGVVARALHAASARASRPLVTVNMGGISEALFESELFGHVKGAFTDAKADRVGRFELADGGTLFLDEIANIPSNQQPKLLRVLETGEFERVGSSRTRHASVRVISATNADLQVEVTAGRFRQDLFFRLNTVSVRLPALRERREDIVLLAAFFLEQQLHRYRKGISGFEPAALELMHSYSWPGNVRELNHAVERGVLMSNGPLIRAADLGLAQSATPETQLENMSLEEVERFLIRKALARSNGNAMSAAEALGLSRSAFYRRLEKYQM